MSLFGLKSSLDRASFRLPSSLLKCRPPTRYQFPWEKTFNRLDDDGDDENADDDDDDGNDGDDSDDDVPYGFTKRWENLGYRKLSLKFLTAEFFENSLSYMFW